MIFYCKLFRTKVKDAEGFVHHVSGHRLHFGGHEPEPVKYKESDLPRLFPDDHAILSTKPWRFDEVSGELVKATKATKKPVEKE